MSRLSAVGSVIGIGVLRVYRASVLGNYIIFMKVDMAVSFLGD